MKLFSILLLSILVIRNFKTSTSEILVLPKTQLSSVVIDIIEKDMIEWISTIHVTMAALTIRSEQKQFDVLECIERQIMKSKKFSVHKIENLNLPRQQRIFNVFLVDSYESFLRIFNKINEKMYFIPGYYIIILSETVVSEVVDNILEKLWKIFIIHVTVVIELENRVNLFTYFPFTETHCRKVIPVLYNTYIDGKFEKNLTTFPAKLENFYGCELNIVTWTCPPHVTFLSSDNGNFEGIDAELVRALSKYLNFTFALRVPAAEPFRGQIFRNGTVTGAMDMIINGDSDFGLCGFAYSLQRTKFVSSSQGYFSTTGVFAVPASAVYTSFERIFFPFEHYIWFYIIVTFVFAFITTTVLKLLGRKYIDFLAGRGNQTPTLQMLNIFYGGSTSIVPRRNFARTLLMFWILTAIVIRGAYQGSLYKFLNSGQARRNMQTVKSVMDDGYHAYIPAAAFIVAEILSLRKEQYTLFKVRETEYFKNLQDPNFRGIIFTTLTTVDYYNSEIADKPNIKVLAERLYTTPVVIYFKKNSFLVEPFNHFIQTFKGHGVINHWAERTNKITFKTGAKDNRKKFRMSDVNGCFQISGIALAMAVFVFILELFSIWFRRLRAIIEFLTY